MNPIKNLSKPVKGPTLGTNQEPKRTLLGQRGHLN